MKKRTPKKSTTRRPTAKRFTMFYGFRVGGKVSVRMDRSKKVRQFASTEIQSLAEFNEEFARVARIRAKVEEALTGLGYKRRGSSSDGAFTDYQYTETLQFESRDDGSITVSLAPNFFG